MTKKEQWDKFIELLENITVQPKDTAMTYLHGVAFGLDYPKKGAYINSVEQDQTIYHAILYNTKKRDELPLKTLLTKDPEGIDLVKFQTPDPEQAEFYLRKHCNLISNDETVSNR
jgi:hypothetical protein